MGVMNGNYQQCLLRADQWPLKLLPDFGPGASSVWEQLQLDGWNMVLFNWAFTLAPAYALYPTLVAHLWPGALQPLSMALPPSKSASPLRLSWATSLTRAWYLLRQPAVHRRLLSVGALICYGLVIVAHEWWHDFWRSNWSAPLHATFSLGWLVALLYLLPARATPLSQIGGCTFVAFVVFSSWIEPRAIHAYSRLALARRLVCSPHWIMELLALYSLAALCMLAGSVSFQMSPILFSHHREDDWSSSPPSPPKPSPSHSSFAGPTPRLTIRLPRCTRTLCQQDVVVPLPVPHFPCGARVWALAWITLLVAIPTLFAIPPAPSAARVHWQTCGNNPWFAKTGLCMGYDVHGGVVTCCID